MPVLASRKTAADKSLEQAVANIAYTRLSDRAPKLFDYVVGFQLLDQSEDRRRAVGLFGFRVGEATFRVPIFYRDGQVFGTEIIMPDSKTFRPLSDNWVQYLVGRSADHPGRPVPSGRTGRAAGPNLWQLSSAPTKWAAENPVEAADFAALRKSAGAVPAHTPRLLEAVAADRRVADRFSALMAEHPWFKQAVDRFYGADAAAKAVASAPPKGSEFLAKRADELPKPRRLGMAVIRVTRIKVKEFKEGPGAALSPPEKARLASGKNVYRDPRPDDAVSGYDEVVVSDSYRLFNPSGATGAYRVSMPGGGTEECFVAGPPLVPGGGGQDCVVVVRLSDGAAETCHRTRVFATEILPDDAWKSWAEKLPAADALKDLPKEDRFLFLTESGQVSAPLRLSGGGAAGEVHLAGEVPHWSQGFSWAPRRNELEAGTPPWDPTGFRQPEPKGELNVTRRSYHPIDSHPAPGHGGRRVVFVPRSAAPREVRDTLVVPAGTRVAKLKGSYDDFDPSWTIQPPLGLHKLAAPSGSRLVIEPRHGGRFRVEDPRLGGRATTKVASDVEADLVESHGFRPAAAEAMLARAAKGRVEFAVKYAAGNLAALGLMDEDYSGALPNVSRAGGVIGGAGGMYPGAAGLEVSSPGYGEQVIQGLAADRSATDPYSQYTSEDPLAGLPVPGGMENGGDKALATAHRAARDGGKDLFDSAALVTILKYTSLDSQLAKMLPATLSAIQWLGRTLAHAYWNSDSYAERYGKAEVAQLTDRLRGQFEELGDLYLLMREQRTGGRDDAELRPDDEDDDA